MRSTHDSPLEAARRGDLPALERLLALHQPRLLRIARSVVRDEVDADDVLQETLQRIYRNLGSLRDDGSFEGWSNRIAVNCARMHLRRRKRSPEVPMEELPPANQQVEASPADVLLQREAAMLAWRAVCELEPKYRRALALRITEDLSMAELGRALGMTTGGAKARLFRARDAVRVRLASYHCDVIVDGSFVRRDARKTPVT